MLRGQNNGGKTADPSMPCSPVTDVDEELQLLLCCPPQRMREDCWHCRPVCCILTQHGGDEVGGLGLLGRDEGREVRWVMQDVGVACITEVSKGSWVIWLTRLGFGKELIECQKEKERGEVSHLSPNGCLPPVATK